MDYKVEAGNLSERVKREVASLGAASSSEIPLATGWNTVRYTGSGEVGGIALSSIESYLVGAYYYDPDKNIWVHILYDTLLVTNMILHINVSQDCTLSGDFSLLIANLDGLVHDKAGNPLPAVSVKLNIVDLSTATGLDGTFSFMNIPIGTYTITCTKTGYKDFKKLTTLSEGDNDIDITMEVKEEVEIPWKWIGIGVGAAAAIGGGIALAKRRKK